MWKAAKIITILIWIVSIYLWAAKGMFYIAAAVFALHFAEIFLKGIPIGIKSGKSKLYSTIMTLIFGFTWWLPVQKEMESK